MLVRSLIAFLVLIAWPFAASVPADQPGAPASRSPFWLWIDAAHMAKATDAAAELLVFDATLRRTIELFATLDEPSGLSIREAAAAFSLRRSGLLRCTKFDGNSPMLEFVPNAQPPADELSPPHRAWASSQLGADAGSPVLEVGVDVDALRLQFTDSFAFGRAGRLIHALGVPNARSLMLHGRWIAPGSVPVFDPALPIPPAARRPGEYAKLNGPPLVRLDLSWNSRSDEPSTIRGTNIAAGHWPATQLKMQPPAAPFLCMFRANSHAWLSGALAIRAAWLEPADSPAFTQSCITWLRTNRLTIDRIVGAVPSWLVVHPAGRFPDWFVVESPLRVENATPDPIVRELDQLIRKQFTDQIEIIPDGGSRFTAPADWPLSVIGWNPNPRPPLSTVRIGFHLRGGKLDGAK